MAALDLLSQAGGVGGAGSGGLQQSSSAQSGELSGGNVALRSMPVTGSGVRGFVNNFAGSNSRLSSSADSVPASLPSEAGQQKINALTFVAIGLSLIALVWVARR